MTCDAEGALGEREDLGGRYREHEDRTTTFEVKAVAARPPSIPLRGPGFGEAFIRIHPDKVNSFGLE